MQEYGRNNLCFSPREAMGAGECLGLDQREATFPWGLVRSEYTGLAHLPAGNQPALPDAQKQGCKPWGVPCSPFSPFAPHREGSGDMGTHRHLSHVHT